MGLGGVGVSGMIKASGKRGSGSVEVLIFHESFWLLLEGG